MRPSLLLLVVLSACRFSPSVDGKALTGCTVDGDCPRGARCDTGTCVPQPLRILSLFVDPDVVEAGETCTFHVEAIHSGDPSELRYWWHQTRGPRQGIVGNGTAVASITTSAGYVGSYELEVRVDNGVEPAAVGRIHCGALISQDAAFIVPNQGGDCSKLLPCSSFDDAPAVKRYYIGVVPAGSAVTFVDASSLTDKDGLEIHGGYVFPGWQRDLDRARTTIFNPANGYSDYACDDCVLAGMTIVYDQDEDPANDRMLNASGSQLTLREDRLVVIGTGTGNHNGFSMLGATGGALGMRLEGLELSIQASGFVGDSLVGITVSGSGGELLDSSIDLRGSGHVAKTGLHYSGALGSTLRADGVTVVTGGAADTATGYWHSCGTAHVADSVFDTRGGQSGSSTAAAFTTESWSGCKAAGHVYSSIFIGGDGVASRAVSLYDDVDTLTFTNDIFDSGNGATRTALGLEWQQSWGTPMAAQHFEGCSFVLEGGKKSLDAWVRLYDDSEMTIEAAETLIACPDCLTTATTVAQVDRAGSDFHLTADSTCCIATGAPLDAEAPTTDRDGVSWASPPSIGAYQYVP